MKMSHRFIGSSRSEVSQVQTGVIVFVVIAALLGAILAIAFLTPSGPMFGDGRVYLVGSGQLVTEEKSFSDFTSVEAETGVEVIITPSNSYSVIITADDNVIDFVRVSMLGETLDIDITPGTSISSGSLRPLTLRVEIAMPELRELELSGAAEGVVTGFTFTEVFVLDLSGASNVVIDGTADDMILRGSGASNADLSNFRVQNADVDLSGASEATINVDGRLDADLSGVSTLLYIGEPTLGNIDVSSLATIRKI